MQPALALVELSSIATGIAVGDAMAKRAPIDLLYA
ncbi:MAG: BMC domain-containing protein, partial [Actinobacteria bacterium]|nr:BMC domain-containing protein [Actinomycetota bacterium]NIS36303.1 BMC domain-containing protein [Actinomycetota bacterium]NIT98649.1 BMC domain-containing protein [Actinomycetota bacterium]NIU22265.1 BMC domain-containing protein [Actinomycetota bacterium]NIU70848.1 BMC domain-containing protein [Actinomycetota bacterium]